MLLFPRSTLLFPRSTLCLPRRLSHFPSHFRLPRRLSHFPSHSRLHHRLLSTFRLPRRLSSPFRLPRRLAHFLSPFHLHRRLSHSPLPFHLPHSVQILHFLLYIFPPRIFPLPFLHNMLLFPRSTLLFPRSTLCLLQSRLLEPIVIAVACALVVGNFHLLIRRFLLEPAIVASFVPAHFFFDHLFVFLIG